MVYYFDEAHKLILINNFKSDIKDIDEKEMRKQWVAKFWTIANVLVDGKGNYFYQFRNPTLFKSRQEAIKKLLNYNNPDNIEHLLVLHTIDSFSFHWLDFYQVIRLPGGGYKIKKLQKKQAFIGKDKKVYDVNGKAVLDNFTLI